MKYDELYHHGIKNQKWGVRNYQNKDGSLTPLGRIRYSKSDGKSNEGNKNSKNQNKIKKDKSVSEMSDDELRTKIDRLRLEKTYKELQPTSQKNISYGKKVVNALSDASVSVIKNSVTNVGTQYVSRELAKFVGVTLYSDIKNEKKDKK